MRHVMLLVVLVVGCGGTVDEPQAPADAGTDADAADACVRSIVVPDKATEPGPHVVCR